MTKKWYKSKTVWVNILTAVAAFGAAIVGDGVVTNPQVLKYLLLGMALVNVVLRFITTTGVR